MEEINKEVQKNELDITSKKLIPNIVKNINDTMNEYASRGLTLPKDYSVENAIIGAYNILMQDKKINTYDKSSIRNSLIQMCTLGLNPNKNQVYFIPYGDKLNLNISYFGKVAIVKRIKGVKDVISDVIYRDTEYELITDEFGMEDIKINKPCPLDQRTGENIIGVWCKVIVDEKIFGRDSHTTIMSIDDVKKSWNQGYAKGQSIAHKNFTAEMCKKTCINRAIKLFINTIPDNDLMIGTLNEVTKNEYEEQPIDIEERKTKVIDL